MLVSGHFLEDFPTDTNVPPTHPVETGCSEHGALSSLAIRQESLLRNDFDGNLRTQHGILHQFSVFKGIQGCDIEGQCGQKLAEINDIFIVSVGIEEMPGCEEVIRTVEFAS